jgi:diguanylate cyclase (GGDEF)-like protein
LSRREAAADRSRASQDRGAGASERTEAELDRVTALADRGAGASERTEAELDRDTALADRGASARERERSSHDGLTGTYLRGPGSVELEREIARARRTEQPLTLAFVDVDGLKAINDSRGHGAGDRVLLDVANALRATLRSHDLIIRYGGDEFACVIAGLNSADATKRLDLVNAALAEAAEPASVTVGVTELQPTDSTEHLLARADAALYRERPEPRRNSP